MYDLERFEREQKETHATVVAELKNGRKRSCWMWYTFPQIVGLGDSYMSRKYAIKSLEEAKAYLDNRLLRDNLYELCNVLLISDKDAYSIFGRPDCYKLKSSMTLFDMVSPDDVFERVLEKFYHGERCEETKVIISKI